MQVIPTIELLNGRCVTLRGGDFDAPTLWHVDPVATARGFVAAGATRLQVTDLDAMQGRHDNDALITEIIRAVGVPVQVAGGIRARERAEFWIAQGAAQVVVGSLAVTAPDMVRALAKYRPDMVLLNFDIRDGWLAPIGRQMDTVLDPSAVLESFAQAPLAGVIVTDHDADAAGVEKHLGVITGLAAQTRHLVFASGLVDTLDDFSRLRYVPNIAGAIVGRALMRKTFTLEQALDVARPQPEETAEFL
ncbi:HisA/HisF-related TIM barrel protein [Pseudoponticoccus marisrubri]|uniref:1-(5-phosphoribosyl)-5-[(5-phosphoribosylamino)methylideneamino]imidazole-4-carboxamideisomerase n=1 Tax=Pseudoponticoccus marisrubri TaxID=1685382 RepID=A0A0W7WMR2_9RHOB|nr:1-(5-phosphoribosyl)-5-[(5-phosphoribosylamino)methylideneamino] imidazole-4-carboxamide isomerase [Pseudoponticoccus marisrubri]KUF11815.1 1-(5-phosphoribosyl)-5-((5-phosphoribosylamino)methylideneamino)imidazole-4-carboxamide isomerase [Pseudoponticoccus marisrubri]